MALTFKYNREYDMSNKCSNSKIWEDSFMRSSVKKGDISYPVCYSIDNKGGKVVFEGCIVKKRKTKKNSTLCRVCGNRSFNKDLKNSFCPSCHNKLSIKGGRTK